MGFKNYIDELIQDMIRGLFWLLVTIGFFIFFFDFNLILWVKGL